jgi:hypothetical protein
MQRTTLAHQQPSLVQYSVVVCQSDQVFFLKYYVADMIRCFATPTPPLTLTPPYQSRLRKGLDEACTVYIYIRVQLYIQMYRGIQDEIVVRPKNDDSAFRSKQSVVYGPGYWRGKMLPH